MPRHGVPIVGEVVSGVLDSEAGMTVVELNDSYPIIKIALLHRSGQDPPDTVAGVLCFIDPPNPMPSDYFTSDDQDFAHAKSAIFVAAGEVPFLVTSQDGLTSRLVLFHGSVTGQFAIAGLK
jgi:hypothetical protein